MSDEMQPMRLEAAVLEWRRYPAVDRIISALVMCDICLKQRRMTRLRGHKHVCEECLAEVMAGLGQPMPPAIVPVALTAPSAPPPAPPVAAPPILQDT